MADNIGVSVCIFTYNYEKFLVQAIESVLAQKTNFPVEIIIGDDCSTDDTRAIAVDYHTRYPGRVLLSFNETNIGGTRNWIRTMNRCKGKYIALLDGDDYFTDEYKLQKQYDACEKDSSYVLCFHGVEEKYEDVSGKDKVVIYEKDEYTIEDFLIRGWFIRTAATFFRNGIAPAEPPEWVYDFPYRYDTILHVFLCMHGKAVCLNDVMAVWRKHSKGMSRKLLEDSIRNLREEIKLSQQLNIHTSKKWNRATKRYVSECYSYLFINIVKSGRRFDFLPLLFTCLRRMKYKIVFEIAFRKLSWK